MSKTLKSMFVGGALALMIHLAAPNDVAAAGAECTEDYLLCMNDTYQFGDGFVRTLGEAECLGGYLGCGARKLRFW
jgi:hypothetical protein